MVHDRHELWCSAPCIGRGNHHRAVLPALTLGQSQGKAAGLRTPHPPALQRQAREALGQALGKGQLRVTLGLVVGLGEAVRAHQQLESRATVGKVVLRV
ncbi:zinc-binding dehydrogenase, partial [Myxococcus eversor]